MTKEKRLIMQTEISDKRLNRKMRTLILDKISIQIKFVLYMNEQTISSLYEKIRPELKEKDLMVASSTFRNLLRLSDEVGRYDPIKRSKIFDIIMEHLDANLIQYNYNKTKNDIDSKIVKLMTIFEEDQEDNQELGGFFKGSKLTLKDLKELQNASWGLKQDF